MRAIRYVVPAVLVAGAAVLQTSEVSSQALTFKARDPGVRAGLPAAGGPLATLTAKDLEYFTAGLDDFSEAEEVDEGLGPTMNLDGCAGCHAQPSVGGSSPAVNPQVAFANKLGATNVLPTFIRADGPVREARFVRNADGSPDGGVHAIFTITGRSDAPGCNIAQPNFAQQLLNKNVVFRIPTPLFGAGLIEAIPDSAILSNAASVLATKSSLGIKGKANFAVAGRVISGQANNNGNDGTIARFGWKAQNKSLLLFSGEAYNVEMGITNEMFPTEREEHPLCQFANVPNDAMNTEAATPIEGMMAIQKFTMFQRFLAPPTPSADSPGGATSIQKGRAQFANIGCTLCHTPTLRTSTTASVPALRGVDANLFSDLLVHDMGPGLADGVSQGQANGREFRTAPLWGLGQRIFFLHDGRTSDLVEAINQHKSGSSRTGNPSEANAVVDKYNSLFEGQKQDLLNFLRSL